MQSKGLEQAINKFITDTNPATAMAVIQSCEGFVVKHAMSWKNPTLSPAEKIREVMAEMFLILLEDFRADLSKGAFSVLSYLGLKLRRLVRPEPIKVMAFADMSDLTDTGRYNFSQAKMSLTNEIVTAVRCALAQQKMQTSGMLEFLFIHIYPEVSWASRLLAETYQEDRQQRHAADRKRHVKFNQVLRQYFNGLKSGSWHEIREWSSGERSHLAWRIIDLSVAQTDSELLEELNIVAQWRDNFTRQKCVIDNGVAAAQKLFLSLKNRYMPVEEPAKAAAEEAQAYMADFDLIGSLLAIVSSNNQVADAAKNYEAPEIKQDESIVAGVFSQDFKQAADEINQWLKQLLKDK
jgi:hypothetical protein